MIDVVHIPRWFDRHLHIRDHGLMQTVLRCTLAQNPIGAVIMGNLNPPDETSTIEKTLAYRGRIMAEVPFRSDFQPRLTCYLTDEISPEEVVQGFEDGVWCAVKLYLADQKGEGGTTGSHRGVRNLLGRYRVFEAMEKHRIPLLGHFEAVEEEVDEFDREIVSVDRDLKLLVVTFPGLPIVVEHVTDGRTADFVASVNQNLYATVTAHHLLINRNAMFRSGLSPGHYCRPVAKRETHRLRVRSYVTSGDRRFGAGTDSAPHDETAKSRCYGCAAGIFTAPTAVELYTQVFDEDNALRYLGRFMSENFLQIYGLKVSSETMTIIREPLQVPQKVGPVQVFRGGAVLPWKLVV